MLKKHEEAQKKTQDVLTKSSSAPPAKVATKNVVTTKTNPPPKAEPSFPQLVPTNYIIFLLQKNIQVTEDDFSQLDEISASLTQIIDDKPISRFNSGFSNSQTPVPKNPNTKVAQDIANITLDIQFSIPPDEFKKETFITMIHNCRDIVKFFQIDQLDQFKPAEFILSVKTLIENVEKLEDNEILLSLEKLTPSTINFVKEVVARGNSMSLDEFDRGADVVQKILTDAMQVMKRAAPKYQQ